MPSICRSATAGWPSSTTCSGCHPSPPPGSGTATRAAASSSIRSRERGRIHLQERPSGRRAARSAARRFEQLVAELHEALVVGCSSAWAVP